MAPDWSWASPTKVVSAVAGLLEETVVGESPLSPTEAALLGRQQGSVGGSRGSGTANGHRERRRRSSPSSALGGGFGLLGSVVNGLGNAVIRGSVNVARGIEAALNDLEEAAQDMAGALDSPSAQVASAQAAAYQKHKRWQQQRRGGVTMPAEQQRQQQRQEEQQSGKQHRGEHKAVGGEVTEAGQQNATAEGQLRVPAAAPLQRQTKSKAVKLGARAAARVAASPSPPKAKAKAEPAKPPVEKPAAPQVAPRAAAEAEASPMPAPAPAKIATEVAASVPAGSEQARLRAELEEANRTIAALEAQNDDLRAAMERERAASDPLAEMMRMQTEALMAERATLKRDVESLSRDNEQLHELVEFLDSNLRSALATAGNELGTPCGDAFSTPLPPLSEEGFAADEANEPEQAEATEQDTEAAVCDGVVEELTESLTSEAS